MDTRIHIVNSEGKHILHFSETNFIPNVGDKIVIDKEYYTVSKRHFHYNYMYLKIYCDVYIHVVKE